MEIFAAILLGALTTAIVALCACGVVISVYFTYRFIRNEMKRGDK